jgi:curved DNA-binding protein CbpA
MNAYELLRLPARLTITPDELGSAFRNAGKSAHPDAGGNDLEFARLHEAQAILASPSRRLRHWLELRGIAVEMRGTMETGLMDVFQLIGTVTQRAEALIRRREETRTPLGRALLEDETQHCREAVEHAIALIESAIQAQGAAFPHYESSPAPDAAAASATARNLAFLEKWQLALRSLYSRLI